MHGASRKKSPAVTKKTIRTPPSIATPPARAAQANHPSARKLVPQPRNRARLSAGAHLASQIWKTGSRPAAKKAITMRAPTIMPMPCANASGRVAAPARIVAQKPTLAGEERSASLPITAPAMMPASAEPLSTMLVQNAAPFCPTMISVICGTKGRSKAETKAVVAISPNSSQTPPKRGSARCIPSVFS